MENDVRKQMHDAHRAELLKRQLSNSENFDRSILTLSSAALGLSVAFIKSIVDVPEACHLWLLIASWCCFAFAIISTLLSYHVSQWGIGRDLALSERYYLKQDDEARNEKNHFATWNDWLGYASAVLFVVGIVALILFASVNLTEKEDEMAQQRQPIPRTQIAEEDRGAKIPEIQAVPSEHAKAGAVRPPIQQVPEAPTNQGGQGAGNGTGGGEAD